MNKFLQVAAVVLALSEAMIMVADASLLRGDISKEILANEQQQQEATPLEGTICPCSCSDPQGVPFNENEGGVLVTFTGVEGAYCIYQGVAEEALTKALTYGVDSTIACASSCVAEEAATEEDTVDSATTQEQPPALLEEEETMTQQETAVVEANNNSGVCPCSCSDPIGSPDPSEAGVLVTMANYEGEPSCLAESMAKEALDLAPYTTFSCALSCTAAVDDIDAAATQEPPLEEDETMTQQEVEVEANNNGVCPCSCSDPIGSPDPSEAGVLVTMANYEGEPFCFAESMVKEALDLAPDTFSCAPSCTAAVDDKEFPQDVEVEEDEMALKLPVEIEQQEQVSPCPCSCSEPLGYPAGTIAGVNGEGVLVTIIAAAGNLTDGEDEAVLYCLDAAMMEGVLAYALADIVSCVTSC